MITEQILTRQMFDMPIRQKHKSQAFCATDLVKAGNKFRISQGLSPFDLQVYYQLKGTKEFIVEIEAKYGWAKYSTKGKYASAWVHPLLFIDIALALHPKLKLEAYEWMMDELCQYRDNSGDSYKKMCGVLWHICTNKQSFPDHIKDVATQIKKACHADDWNTADKRQLAMRDSIQEDISWLGEEMRDATTVIRLAIQRNRV